MDTPHWIARAFAVAFAALTLLPQLAVAVANAQPKAVRPIVFLTREGCVNTTRIRSRLDQALDRLGAAKDYAVIDADTLSESDVRRGYGTPTVLFDNRDLFGLPEPAPPLPSPT